MFKVPEENRIKYGRLKTDETSGNNGAFLIDSPICNRELFVLASDGMGWEHVSVSLKNRCPNWPEMCHIKNLFWSEEDIIVQFHPRKSEYIDNHPFCLHLWKNKTKSFPTPDSILVGLKNPAAPNESEKDRIRGVLK